LLKKKKKLSTVVYVPEESLGGRNNILAYALRILEELAK
jgi:hypothetical protein